MPGQGKKYYRIGEVSELIGVEPHVLRYWEGEFRQIRTHRVAKQRLYRIEDIDFIRHIKTLLYDEGFTIAGAGRRIAEEQKMKDAKDRTNKLLKEIRHGLIAIREMIGPNNG
ncbi:MAG: MerR family transcriptional regulator [Thermodesulfobacteriota bacterium]|nr:MerR family transcriptional regulator [Thermodesulfobacteriota bacterium]